ncbi:MAG: rod shape-determining protein RodA [Rhodospirillaceae bacterium]|nr:rod shape-determining protein RodA [Rhodospirillaceae bacterium]|tara:strand:+ start:11977 stop:13113 length:1137 start_codon:yes stop_codon:yes gene_type:complete
MSDFSKNKNNLTFFDKVKSLNLFIILLILILASIGFIMLYSVSGGSADPWMRQQIFRFSFGFFIMLSVAFLDLRFLLSLSYPIYFFSLLLLVAVEFFGSIGMGAQRWIDLGIFHLQPSEIMKIALVMALAKYFHSISHDDIRTIRWILPPLLMIIVPSCLVLIEPDLGTAILLILEGTIILFIAGVRWWKFIFVSVVAVLLAPFFWTKLHSYQQNRVLTFFNPERDPLGSGYHIIQSKIAFGSGGLWGKGYLLGTQSHLNFLPEKHTDFIFTALAEEFGLVGGLIVLLVYVILIIYSYIISMRSRSNYGRILGIGITSTFFLYIFINISMVMGLIPVVGVPLPLISYGGTAIVTILFSFGILLCIHINKNLYISKSIN